MRMLTPAEESEDAPEVNWEDQQRINSFSKFNTRSKDLEETLEKRKEEREALDDLSTELELADENQPVLYKVGETFLHVSVSKALTLLASHQITLEKDINGLQERLGECTTEMTNLKIVLYAKFGKAINLD
ncbi:hypothetical protein BS47DRAFT_1489044 [Hydnum rufescens UP504]|uniref:Prefoldin subunit 4 n=1 Tax=Hydnum rufescens UP504 TaxID=1448309 RepID=A0A9P6DMN2_9AGAM|nr:hypothetical protein BS47DRAFT_1489044 [Hydnum rufescens UP504]